MRAEKNFPRLCGSSSAASWKPSRTVSRAADEYLELAQAYPDEKQGLLAQMAAGRIYLKRLNRPEDALRLYEAAQASSIPHADWQATIDRGIAEAKKPAQPQPTSASSVS